MKILIIGLLLIGNSCFSQSKVHKKTLSSPVTIDSTLQTMHDTSSKKTDVPMGFRVHFDDLFQTNQDGSLSPKYNIQLGGVSISPGVSFNKGVSFGGMDIFQYQGHDFQVDTVKGIVIIKGVYK